MLSDVSKAPQVEALADSCLRARVVAKICRLPRGFDSGAKMEALKSMRITQSIWFVLMKRTCHFPAAQRPNLCVGLALWFYVALWFYGRLFP